MSAIQTLTLNRKKFALMPYDQYKKLLEQIEDLKDIAEIKKRSKEPRIPFEEVKRQYFKNHK